MAKKTTKAQREANRKRVAAWRERHKNNNITETVTNTDIHRDTAITDADIELLPPSLKFQLEAQTRVRKILKLPDNLRERTEMMVQMFRGY